MSFPKVTDELVFLLQGILADVPKAMKGNKTAAQRIRTRTVRVSKVAKEWRKLSLQQGKKKKKARKTSSLRRKKQS